MTAKSTPVPRDAVTVANANEIVTLANGVINLNLGPLCPPGMKASLARAYILAGMRVLGGTEGQAAPLSAVSTLWNEFGGQRKPAAAPKTGPAKPPPGNRSTRRAAASKRKR